MSKQKKNSYFSLYLFLAIFLLVACSPESSNSNSEIESSIEKSVATESKEESIEIEEIESVFESEESVDDKELEEAAQELTDAFGVELVLNTLKETFQDNMDVWYDSENSMYCLVPLDEGFVYEVMRAAAGDPDSLASWEELIDSFMDLSESTYELSGQFHSISILNPSNEEKILLTVAQGLLLYDSVSGYMLGN